jgi:hypothetical protein
MSLEKLADLSTIVQAVLVTGSLIFVWAQLKQNAALTKAANAQALAAQAGAFNALLIESSDLARLWYSCGRDLQGGYDRERYRELLVQWLIFHEGTYYQYQSGLLDKALYSSWREDLK